MIVGGNECMVRQYKDLCGDYKCKAKVYPKMQNGLKNIGTPDLQHDVAYRILRECGRLQMRRLLEGLRRYRCSKEAVCAV